MRVVDSAAALAPAKFSTSHSPKSRASRAVLNMNTGARCIERLTTVVVTPPHSVSTRMPRL